MRRAPTLSLCFLIMASAAYAQSDCRSKSEALWEASREFSMRDLPETMGLWAEVQELCTEVQIIDGFIPRVAELIRNGEKVKLTLGYEMAQSLVEYAQDYAASTIEPQDRRAWLEGKLEPIVSAYRFRADSAREEGDERAALRFDSCLEDIELAYASPPE